MAFLSAILSNSEEHTGLARAMAQLADAEDKVCFLLIQKKTNKINFNGN